MKIPEVIKALQALQEMHGQELDVTLWQYGGGLDDLCEVEPRFNEEARTVVMEAGVRHGSGARR